jgi:hypothetical protein
MSKPDYDLIAHLEHELGIEPSARPLDSIPTDRAELEALLADPDTVKRIMGDKGKLAEYIKAYAKAVDRQTAPRKEPTA